MKINSDYIFVLSLQGILCPENRRLERGGIRPPSYLL